MGVTLRPQAGLTASLASSKYYDPEIKPWDCLAFHPRTTPFWRWGLPCLVLAVAGLTIAANTAISTSVTLQLIGDSKPIMFLPRVFGFSLVSSVKDMWDGGVYPLALLIIGFSGIWPYVKLGTMLLCWFGPTGKFLSPGRRLWLMEFLDNWGKWSLIDAFFMFLFMVAFKFSLSSETETVSPGLKNFFDAADTNFSANIYVIAGLGYHAFLISILGSLTVGHLMTSANRYAYRLGEYSEEAQRKDDTPTRLCDSAFKGEAKPLYIWGPVVAMGIPLVLVVIGIWIEAFAFTFEGAGGWVLGYG